MTDEDLPVRRVRARVMYRNDFVTLYDDDVAFAEGGHGRHVRLEPMGGPGVVVLPLRAGQVAVVRTYRYAIGRWQWGLPRGFGHGDDVVASAAAELAEELGVDDATLTVIGEITPDSGLLASRVAVVRADVTTGELRPRDVAEVHQARWLDAAQVLELVRAPDAADGISLAALLLGLARNAWALPADRELD